MHPHILILGLGNILLRDEGLGVRALERLHACYELPPQVKALDGGTLGLDLLPHLEEAADLLVIDAIHGNQPAGTLVRLEGDAITAALALMTSMHQLGLQELLAVGKFRGTLPERIVVWGMQPACLDYGLELSLPVAGQLDSLVEAVVQELMAWDVQAVPRAISDA